MVKIIILPIYMQLRKTGAPQLIGMNWYSRAHQHQQHAVRKYYSNIIRSHVNCMEIDEPIKKFKTRYSLYYKNPSSDPSNIVQVMEKLLLDGLQDAGVLTEDNAKHHVGSDGWDSQQDKENPRIECFVWEVY